MIQIEERQKQRFLFLNKLYDLVNDNQRSTYNMYEIGKSIHFDFDTVRDIVTYLENEGLVNNKEFGGTITGIVAITHKGVREIEQAHENPESPTSKFPAQIVYYVRGDFIKAEHVSGSGIVIGKDNAIRDININLLDETLDTINNEFSKDLKDFSKRIRDEITKRGISEEQAKPIFAAVITLAKELADINGKEKQDIDFEK